MAWINQRTRKDGGITYYVTWREPGASKESTLTIRDDKAEAERNVRLLEANGNSYAAAERAAKNAKMGGITLEAWMHRHVDLLTRASDAQIQRYRRAIRDHFAGAAQIGGLPLQAVEQSDVIRWIRYMQNKKHRGKPYSAKTIANHHALLSAAMRRAHNTGEISVNPCLGIELPEDDRIEEPMRFMTVSESLAVVMALPPRYRPFMAFLRGSGARFSEATALYPSDFHFDEDQPYVQISKAHKMDGSGKRYIGPPKTKKARRRISLPPSLVTFIRPTVESAKPGQHAFRTSYEGEIRASTFYEFWAKALDDLKYPKDSRPRIHDMRHTHASIMLAGGMDIYELSRRLGHRSIQTTVDRYSHLLPDAHFRAATIAEKSFGALPAPPTAEELTNKFLPKELAAPQ